MARRGKPEPKRATPVASWREAERQTIARLQADPHFRAGQAHLRRLVDDPVMREAAEIGRRLREPQRRDLSNLSKIDKSKSAKTASKRGGGRGPKLTPDEIARGIVLIRAANVEHHKNYPMHKFKQTEAIKVLKRKLKRDGAPVKVSTTTWLRLVVRPALGQD